MTVLKGFDFCSTCKLLIASTYDNTSIYVKELKPPEHFQYQSTESGENLLHLVDSSILDLTFLFSVVTPRNANYRLIYNSFELLMLRKTRSNAEHYV